MPDEELKLTEQERAAIQRMADAKKMSIEDVVETIAVQALMQYPRDDEEPK